MDIDSFSINYGTCSVIDGRLTLRGNLDNLEGLNSIDSIIGDLFIQETSNLISTSGLMQLKSVGGEIRIEENNNLQQLVLPSLIESGPIILIDNFDLNSIDFLSIQKAGGILVLDSRELVSINMPTLRQIDGDLKLISNNKLQEIDLSNLRNIEGAMDLGFLENLRELNTRDNLESIGGFLKLQSIPGFDNLDFLSRLSYIGGFISINQMPLKNIEGLHQIDTVHGSFFLNTGRIKSISDTIKIKVIEGGLSLIGGSMLESLGGLGGVEKIKGGISINWSKLTDLRDFSRLQSIKGGISLRFNSELETLEGIYQISSDSIRGLVLENNESLSFCSAPNICAYIARTNNHTISNNAEGCNDVSEVSAGCKKFFSIPYKIFYDANQDGKPGVGDFDLSHFPLEVDPLSVKYFSTSKDLIKYLILPQGSYSISIQNDLAEDLEYYNCFPTL